MSPSKPARSKSSAKADKAKEAAKAPSLPPVQNALVPAHELLTEAEGRTVLNDLGTPLERLPKILSDDPGLLTDAKFRAAKEAHEELAGRLVRIRRPSPTAGEAIAYRVIASGSGE